MDRTRKKSVKRYFDYSLLFVTIFIAGFGLIMIYSTSSYTAQMKFGNAQYYFKKQLMFMLLGFVAMYIAYRIDYHVWHKEPAQSGSLYRLHNFQDLSRQAVC